MTDYTELVKELRHCSHDGLVKCNECKYGGKEWPVGCEEEMMLDAAAAIEALETEIRESMQKCAECGDEQEQKVKELQAEVRFWKAAVKGQEDGIKVLQAEVERLKADVDAAYAH